MIMAFTGSPADLSIILIVALLLFGPKKLPELGQQLGRAMREFRKVTDELTGVTHSVREEFKSVYRPTVQPATSYSETLSEKPKADVQGHDDLMEPAHPEQPQRPRSGLVLSTVPSEDEPLDNQATKGR